jgi:2-methylisocitrate lyase-like PEP mutase family enzyme
VVERSDLVDWGFDVAIYPTAGMNVACAAIEASYLHLLNHGSTTASLVPAYTMAQLHDLVGFPEVWAFERRFVES